MADDYKAPASPAAYVYWHILQKGWQAGSLIGVAGVVPVLALWKKVRDPATLLRAINYSALSGTAATGMLSYLLTNAANCVSCATLSHASGAFPGFRRGGRGHRGSYPPL